MLVGGGACKNELSHILFISFFSMKRKRDILWARKTGSRRLLHETAAAGSLSEALKLSDVIDDAAEIARCWDEDEGDIL